MADIESKYLFEYVRFYTYLDVKFWQKINNEMLAQGRTKESYSVDEAFFVSMYYLSLQTPLISLEILNSVKVKHYSLSYLFAYILSDVLNHMEDSGFLSLKYYEKAIRQGYLFACYDMYLILNNVHKRTSYTPDMDAFNTIDSYTNAIDEISFLAEHGDDYSLEKHTSMQYSVTEMDIVNNPLHQRHLVDLIRDYNDGHDWALGIIFYDCKFVLNDSFKIIWDLISKETGYTLPELVNKLLLNDKTIKILCYIFLYIFVNHSCVVSDSTTCAMDRSHLKQMPYVVLRGEVLTKLAKPTSKLLRDRLEILGEMGDVYNLVSIIKLDSSESYLETILFRLKDCARFDTEFTLSSCINISLILMDYGWTDLVLQIMLIIPNVVEVPITVDEIKYVINNSMTECCSLLTQFQYKLKALCRKLDKIFKVREHMNMYDADHTILKKGFIEESLYALITQTCRKLQEYRSKLKTHKMYRIGGVGYKSSAQNFVIKCESSKIHTS